MTTNLIRIPEEHADQLLQIAAAEGKTIVEALSGMIRAKVAEGVIPAAVPGINVAKTGDVITIKTARGFEAAVPVNQGPTLADLLKNPGAASDPERKKRWIEGLAAMSGIKVKRSGNSLTLINPMTGREYALALTVAAAVADQIEQEANRAA
ncbi:hypothetical protein GCM10007291_15230 [Gemmobacter nanjingensis]|uniref:Uncharacterized protein n=1 Tax=Gemmobacter nanjingensis TaxID=488454 RepID=A0ABQ3FBW3_9RHOB|nr:hypothetical protein [Gemmobacter nanjingensis]GHC17413.1 hypothetical protein GCM10007291_15230 [Gemmobacter nanjingensis]